MNSFKLSIFTTCLLLIPTLAKPTANNMPADVLENIILSDVQVAETAIVELQQELQPQPTTRNHDIDTSFTKLVEAWKAIQATYVLGEFDSAQVDTPRLMDIYHEGNEDLSQQLDRLLKSGDPANEALFKNSFKSINALEYFLFADKALDPAEINYANYTLTTLAKHLKSIQNSYKEQTEAFIKDTEITTSYLLNALIDSSYKLAQWRVGEAAGLAKKYQGKPDNRRQEYPLSQASWSAIKGIIDVHDNMIGQRDYDNLGSHAIKSGAEKEVKLVRELINRAKQQLQHLQAHHVENFSDPQVEKLYQTLSSLNDAYYQSLVQALPVQARILDADGD